MNETVVPRIESANKIEMKNGMGMYKFAEPKVVDITPFSDEIFEEEVVGNDKIYRQKIIAEKGFSITISFYKLFLPDNSELYIYNPERTVVTGPITSKENRSVSLLYK